MEADIGVEKNKMPFLVTFLLHKGPASGALYMAITIIPHRQDLHL